MPIVLSREKLVTAPELITLAESRLEEARVLLREGHYAGAVYLAGYSIECCLKAAICKSLDWERLLGLFKTHDLEGLLLYSGFDRQLRSDPILLRSFTEIIANWSEETRYTAPDSIDRQRAEEFLGWVIDSKVGVVTWLQSRIR